MNIWKRYGLLLLQYIKSVFDNINLILQISTLSMSDILIVQALNGTKYNIPFNDTTTVAMLIK